MAKSQETFNKKEKEKKKLQKRKEKAERMAERKANAKTGKTMEDMMAYVDENGNITSSPPDPTKRTKIKEEDIMIGARTREPEDESTRIKKGRVAFFNSSKGFGFIKDDATGDSVFVHVNSVTFPIKENDRVTFEVTMGNRGLAAINIKKI